QTLLRLRLLLPTPTSTARPNWPGPRAAASRRRLVPPFSRTAPTRSPSRLPRPSSNPRITSGYGKARLTPGLSAFGARLQSSINHDVIPAKAGIHPEIDSHPQQVLPSQDGFRPAPE